MTTTSGNREVLSELTFSFIETLRTLLIPRELMNLQSHLFRLYYRERVCGWSSVNGIFIERNFSVIQKD